MQPVTLSRQTASLYAASVMPIAVLGLPLSVFLPPFVTEGGVIAVGLVGLLFMLTTIWDGVVDPVIGRFMDKRKGHVGAHRRWIWLSALPLALVLMCIALLGNDLPFLPLFLLMLLFTSTYSIFDVAHLAWGSALADSDTESSRLFGAREWASKFGLLLAFAAPALAQFFIPDLDNAGRILAYSGLALLLLPVALWATIRLPDRPSVPQPGLGWREEWRVTLGFPALLLLILTQLLNTFGLGAVTSLFVFFADGVLGMDQMGPLLLLISFVGAAILTPLWTKLAIRIGKPRGMAVMSLWLIASLASAMLLPRVNLPAAALFAFALGSGFVGLLFIYGIAADLTVADRDRCNRDRTAFVFSLVNLAQKVGTAFGIGFSYAALDWFGFDPGNTAASADLIRNLYVGIPVASWIGVALVLLVLARDPATRRATSPTIRTMM
jgi:Na+/melibiose symporter-like transporter